MMDKSEIYKNAYDLNIAKDINSILNLINTMSSDSMKLWVKKAKERYGTDYKLDNLKTMLKDINGLTIDDEDIVKKQAVLKILSNSVLKSDMYTPALEKQELGKDVTLLGLFHDVEVTELSNDFEKVFAKEIDVYTLINTINDKLDVLNSIESDEVKSVVGEIKESIEAFGPASVIDKVVETPVDASISEEAPAVVEKTTIEGAKVDKKEDEKEEEVEEEVEVKEKESETPVEKKEPEVPADKTEKVDKSEVEPENKEDNPTNASEDVKDPNPDKIPEVTPETAPEASPEVKEPVVPEVTPKTTSENVPEEPKAVQLSKDVAQVLRDTALELSKKSRELDVKTEMITGYKKKVIELRSELDTITKTNNDTVIELQGYKNKELKIEKQVRDSNVTEIIELYNGLGIEKTSENFFDVSNEKLLELKDDLSVFKKNATKEITTRSTKRSVELKTTPVKKVDTEIEEFNLLFGK